MRDAFKSHRAQGAPTSDPPSQVPLSCEHMTRSTSIFPITPLLPEIRTSLAASPRLVLEAPPGAGKTTQVPLALLDAEWLAGRKIVVLEPRRIAARAAAQFMARQLGEEVGQTVGYRIRFESKVSAATRIEVVTEGILTRLIQDDPELTGIGAILFDEFHERHLAGDLGAALALDVQATLCPDLRLLVMSATLDGERIAQWLDAPRITSPGRSFPVRIEHPPARTQESLEHQVARVVIEEASGTIVMGANVRVSTVAIAQGNLTIRITETPQVSQPGPLSNGETTVVPRTNVEVDDQAERRMGVLRGGVTLQELVRGLNALGVGPRDLISILQSVKAAGALQAEMELR